MLPEISLPLEELAAEDGLLPLAGVPFAVREDPVLGEKYRQWVNRCRKRMELDKLVAEIQEIGQRMSKGDATASGELRRVGESLIEMAKA